MEREIVEDTDGAAAGSSGDDDVVSQGDLIGSQWRIRRVLWGAEWVDKERAIRIGGGVQGADADRAVEREARRIVCDRRNRTRNLNRRRSGGDRQAQDHRKRDGTQQRPHGGPSLPPYGPGFRDKTYHFRAR